MIHKRCFKNFNEDLFEKNLKNIDWGHYLTSELNDVNFFFPTYSQNQ